MLSGTIDRYIRTYVPLLVAMALTALGRAIGIHIDTATAAIPAVGAVFAVYYTLARFLEKRFPALGWLLGVPIPKAAPMLPVLHDPQTGKVISRPPNTYRGGK